MGVSFNQKGQKWVAYVVITGKRVHIGSFDTEFEATDAVDATREDMAQLQKWIEAECLNVTLWDLMHD